MKSYTLRISILFSTILAIVALVAYGAYVFIADNFVSQKAQENMLYINQKIALHVDLRINYDYDKLQDTINNLDSANGDTLDQLNDLKDELFLGNMNYLAFGSIANDRYTIDGVNYLFNDEFLYTDYYNQNVAVFAFGDAFRDNENKEPRGFFKVGNIIAVFDAIDYFDPMFLEVENAPENQYFIISKDGLIQYQIDHETNKDKLFEHYVRGLNDEEQIEKVVANLYDGKSGV
ncbi:MAG: hypothetical protein PHP65_03325, partial [Bacilli bacterium]|nr:hypothetical protein [Bacilli bacterium]